VSGKLASSFSVSGPPLYGKEAAAVSETSLHIKRTPHTFHFRTYKHCLAKYRKVRREPVGNLFYTLHKKCYGKEIMMLIMSVKMFIRLDRKVKT
jgi:hypothetical protein